jgi:hypothetical protein
VAAGLVALPLATGCTGSSASAGAWPQPRTVASPTQAAPGQVVTVAGDGLWDDCDDTGRHLELHPLRDLAVIFEQETVSELARTDAAGARARAEVAVTIPATAAPGPATIRIHPASAAHVTITRP